MALTLSNSGISSGSVINAAQISQSIDAFTGAEAYNITLSGSFTMKGDQQITSDPDHKGTSRMFECTKSIKPREVLKAINNKLKIDF